MKQPASTDWEHYLAHINGLTIYPVGSYFLIHDLY